MATMLLVVVVLFGRHEDQLKNGHPWKSTSSHWVPTNGGSQLYVWEGWFVSLRVCNLRS